jgi:hypothetical protein
MKRPRLVSTRRERGGRHRAGTGESPDRLPRMMPSDSTASLQRGYPRSVRAVFACELGRSDRLAPHLGLSLMSAFAGVRRGGAGRCGRCIIPKSCSDLIVDGSSCARTAEGSVDRRSPRVSTIPSIRSRRLNEFGKATASGGFLQCGAAPEDGDVTVAALLCRSWCGDRIRQAGRVTLSTVFDPLNEHVRAPASSVQSASELIVPDGSGSHADRSQV